MRLSRFLTNNDPSRLKVLPMSDDIIFVLQTDSSLRCRECRHTGYFRSKVQLKLQLFEVPIEIFDIHQSSLLGKSNLPTKGRLSHWVPMVFILGFPTGRDSATFRDSGTGKNVLSRDKGTTGQKFLHCPGTKGQQNKLKILPRDRPGRDSQNSGRDGPG